MTNLQVKVTNGNDFELPDMFDGIQYVIPANGNLNIPYEAACHIFGVDFSPNDSGALSSDLRKDAFNHVERRWGWNRSFLKDKNESVHKIRDSAKEAFDKISFEVVTMQMVERSITSDGLASPRASAPGGGVIRRFLGGKGEAAEAGAA